MIKRQGKQLPVTTIKITVNWSPPPDYNTTWTGLVIWQNKQKNPGLSEISKKVTCSRTLNIKGTSTPSFFFVNWLGQRRLLWRIPLEKINPAGTKMCLNHKRLYRIIAQGRSVWLLKSMWSTNIQSLSFCLSYILCLQSDNAFAFELICFKFNVWLCKSRRLDWSLIIPLI